MKYKFKRRFAPRHTANTPALKKIHTEIKPFTALARNEEIDLFGVFEEQNGKVSLLSRLTCIKAFFRKIFPKRKRRPPIRASILLKILCVVLAVATVTAVAVIYSVFGVFFRRYRLLTVPDLIGMSEQEALTQGLESFEYTVKYEYNPSMKEGCVISQSPPPNVERKLYTGTQKLLLKLTVNTAAPSTSIESVVGLGERDALLLLKNAGIEVTVIEEWSDTVPVGVVTYCSYASGDRLSVGQNILLKVSRGKKIPLVIVPELCGLSESDAIERLEKSGLAAGQIKYQSSDLPLGRVISQEYTGGTEIEMGKSVAFTVSGGRGFE